VLKIGFLLANFRDHDFTIQLRAFDAAKSGVKLFNFMKKEPAYLSHG